MSLIDTHCHLDDGLFDDVAAVVERARGDGVTNVITVATSLASSRRCIVLSEEHAEVWAAVGIHPNEAAAAGASDFSAVASLVGRPRVVALGETGLDRYWNDTPFDLQQNYFRRHFALSAQTGLPVIIHQRDCPGQMLAFLKEMAREFGASGRLNGVMHSFTGDAAFAAACLELGLYISFAGIVTFKKAADLREVAKTIPADRILVETDAPFLSPEPLRGKHPNEPARVVHTARRLAETRGEDFGAFCEQTTRNARSLFHRGRYGYDA